MLGLIGVDSSAVDQIDLAVKLMWIILSLEEALEMFKVAMTLMALAWCRHANGIVRGRC